MVSGAGIERQSTLVLHAPPPTMPVAHGSADGSAGDVTTLGSSPTVDTARDAERDGAGGGPLGPLAPPVDLASEGVGASGTAAADADTPSKANDREGCRGVRGTPPEGARRRCKCK
jgi:hypothetical protein